MELAPRLNLITGDNGLGKSFLLDVAWWALTRKWPQRPQPEPDLGLPCAAHRRWPEGHDRFSVESKTGRVEYESSYVPAD